MVAQGVRDFGEAVARQIDQAPIVRKVKEIDQAGSARRLAGSSNLPPIDDDVQGAGLAGIGSPGNSDLGPGIRDKLSEGVGALDETGFGVV